MASVSRSKTTVPGLPPEFVRRPALLTALDRGEDRALTLVCAPPGYGKTLLLADWIRRQDAPCAWVTLDEDDDDPRRLWTAVLAALRGLPGRAGVEPAAQPRRAADDRRRRLPHRRARGARGRPDATPAGPRRRPPPPEQGDPAGPAAPPAAAAGAPSGWSWPAGSIPRCPSRGCAWRSGSASCAPSSSPSRAEETATLADLCGLDLDAEPDRPAPRAHRRVGGRHPARRDAAAGPPRARPLPRGLLRRRAAGGRLPHRRGVRAHLRRRRPTCSGGRASAIRCPAALAAELSGRADAADVLGALERSTGLVVATGEHHTEFRIQELIRSYLYADLYRHGPALAAQLHRQAAVWWADQGRPVEALQHAAQGDDDGLVTALLHRWAPQLVARGEHVEAAPGAGTRRGRQRGRDGPVAPPRLGTDPPRGRRTSAPPRPRSAGPAPWPPGPDDDDLAHFRAATARMAGLGRLRARARRRTRRPGAGRARVRRSRGGRPVRRRGPVRRWTPPPVLRRPRGRPRHRPRPALRPARGAVPVPHRHRRVAWSATTPAPRPPRPRRSRRPPPTDGRTRGGRPPPTRCWRTPPDARRCPAGRWRSRPTGCGSARPAATPSSGSPCAARAAAPCSTWATGRAGSSSCRRPTPSSAGPASPRRSRPAPRCSSTGRPCCSGFPAASTDVHGPPRRPRDARRPS